MKHIYISFLLFLSLASLAQEQHCATDVVMRRIYKKNPALKLLKRQQDEAQRGQLNRPATITSYTVPIVFHILHVGGVENISDAQVKDAVRILNRDYAKRNPDTTEIIPAFKNIADSTNIHFALATLDPLGNCTNGIKHYYDTDTDWDDTSPTLYSHTWDPTKYLNVYIVRTITLTGGFGAAGYTYFPGTWPSGDASDAIVVLNHYFGSIGTGDNFLSRVLTHEIGHWFNLYHVFGGSNGAGIDCSDDDFVSDTPPTPGYLNCPNAAIPSQYQICTPGISENYQNYMDYSYCCRMFTQGQALRMQAALQSTLSGRNNLWSNANLIATGVINPTVPCLPIADFKYSRSKTCAGTPVVFTDATWNGQPTGYNWSFPGGTPATSTASAPVVTYATPGLYSVTYSSSNAAGVSSPLTKSNIITVSNNTAAYTTPWSEGFESLATLNNDWTLVNSNGSAKWEQSSDASYTGTFSAKLAPANNTRKNVVAMISPAIDLSMGGALFLKFKLATAEITPNHVNTLKVSASIDCGNSWTTFYSRTGANLITSNSSAANFIPANHSEWRQEVIDLQALGFIAYANFKFEYTRDTIPSANNIFIDDINISSGQVSIAENALEIQNLSVFPVPSKGSVTVAFDLVSAQNIKFSLLDISGRELQSTNAEFPAGKHSQLLNAANSLVPGIYFLSIRTDKTTVTRKLIIGE